jgi:arylsulfatase A-like enzyme
VASEIDGGKAGLLVLPLLVALLPLVLERLPRVRSWIRTDPGSARRPAPWRWAVRSLPLLALLAVPPSSRTSLDYRSGSLVHLIRDMTADALGTQEAPALLASTAGPLFDTQELRLVPTDSTRRMNVVFIVMESVRSRSATPYEPTLPTMPFLDTLARQSLMVEQMFTVVPHTNKSLTAMFAGIYPKLSRDIAEGKPGGIPGVGLPALLKPFDYRSAFFTPATLAYEDKDQMLANLGFDAAFGADSYPPEGFAAKEYFGYEDRIVLAPSLDWVDEATREDRPFFLAYLTLSSHHPYDLPDSFARQDYPTPNKVLNHYYNALRYTDDFLRDLIAGFEARGLIDNTLFVLVGDHGEAFGEHQQRTHGDVIWDEGLQVPALLYSPRLFPEGGRITGSRQHIDFLPTLAQALGYRLEGGHYPGRSLLASVPADRPLYHSCWNGDLSLALRRDSLKFIYNHGRSPMQVFDVANDPLEKNDLAASYPPATLRAVQMDLLLWRAGVARAYDREEWHLARADERR